MTLLSLTTATRVSAMEGKTFKGIGFFRMGYEYSHRALPSSTEPTIPDQVELEIQAILDRTREMHQLIPTEELLEVGRSRRKSDDTLVVLHRFLFFRQHSLHRPFASDSGWAWVPGATNLVLKPFAQFETADAIYRNYDPTISADRNHVVNIDDKGVILNRFSDYDNQ